MTKDDDRLLHVVAAALEGESPDWSRAEADCPAEEDRAVLAGLREIGSLISGDKDGAALALAERDVLDPPRRFAQSVRRGITHRHPHSIDAGDTRRAARQGQDPRLVHQEIGHQIAIG